MAATSMEMYARFLEEHDREGEAKVQKDAAAAIRKPHFAGLSTPSPGNTAVMRANKAAGVMSPQLVKKQEPEYTEEARFAKLQGKVVLSVEIGVDGLVHNAKVTTPLGMGLDENAIAAVKQWQFTPGTADGSPVTVAAAIEINFRLL
jgi:protein TonB